MNKLCGAIDIGGYPIRQMVCDREAGHDGWHNESETGSSWPPKAVPKPQAATLELGHAKRNDAHCLACGFKMVGGANVGLCPKCGSNRWYKTTL